MRRYFCGIFFLLLNTSHASPIASFLWGKKPDNSIQVGALLYHAAFKSENDPAIMARPYIGLTYSSLYLAYFKSCDYDDAVGVGLQRSLYSHTKENHRLSLGYRLALAYGGWCYKGNGEFATATSCKGKVPLLPLGQLILDYSYKNVGLELGALGPLFTLNFVYRFSS